MALFLLAVWTRFVRCGIFFTLVGAMDGSTIPDSWALDFALPITFSRNLIAPMFRTSAHIVAGRWCIPRRCDGACGPIRWGLILAGLAGMIAGAQPELWLGTTPGPTTLNRNAP